MTRPCDITSDAALDQLRREILRLASVLLHGAGINGRPVRCELHPRAGRLVVRFDLPMAVSPAVKQALAVRVLDAVRGAGRTYGPVDVSVHGPT